MGNTLLQLMNRVGHVPAGTLRRRHSVDRPALSGRRRRAPSPLPSPHPLSRGLSVGRPHFQTVIFAEEEGHSLAFGREEPNVRNQACTLKYILRRCTEFGGVLPLLEHPLAQSP